MKTRLTTVAMLGVMAAVAAPNAMDNIGNVTLKGVMGNRLDMMIERHVTISHEMWGTDQQASLEVQAMGMLTGRLRNIREMMGSGEKELSEKELAVRKKLRG